MKKWLVGLCLCVAAVAGRAQTVWFTVMGSEKDPNVNTVQVDPVPIEVNDAGRIMKLRINRSTESRNWEGVPYRSYNARVQIDCGRRTAKYLWGEFFNQPLWQGTPHVTTDYTVGPTRQMLFLDVEPNPTMRIIRAACPVRELRE